LIGLACVFFAESIGKKERKCKMNHEKPVGMFTSWAFHSFLVLIAPRARDFSLLTSMGHNVARASFTYVRL